jgi:hypothetical protein
MKLARDVPLIVITFLGTFYFTAWGMLPLLGFYYRGEFLVLAVPTVFALLAAVFVWTQSASTGGTLGHGRRLGTGVVAWYLTTVAVLAATRLALLVWMNHRHLWWSMPGEMESFVVWLYPEEMVELLWSLQGLYERHYYLVWCSMLTVGSFVMATPILLVGWLRNRHTTPPPSR